MIFLLSSVTHGKAEVKPGVPQNGTVRLFQNVPAQDPLGCRRCLCNIWVFSFLLDLPKGQGDGCQEPGGRSSFMLWVTAHWALFQGACCLPGPSRVFMSWRSAYWWKERSGPLRDPESSFDLGALGPP